MKKIAVIGAGYVGLVTGSCFAQKGNFVIIVEKDSKKIQSLCSRYLIKPKFKLTVIYC